MTRFLLLFMVMAANIFASPKEKPSRIIPYKETPQGELRLHVFNPPNHKHQKDQRPVVVFFFGGSWNTGSPAHFYPQAKYLAQRGLVAITAEYRTKKSHGTDPRVCVRDAKSAIRFIRRRAKWLGISPTRIAAAGGSAGGHLAAATATLSEFNEPDENLEVSCKPNALVLFNPVFDNSENGYGFERVNKYWKDFSPMHNLSSNTPPTIVFLGTKDEFIPVATAEKYKEIMTSNGTRCDLHLYSGQAHGFFNKAKYKETVAQMDQFLVSLGWLKEMPKPEKRKPIKKKQNVPPPHNK